MNTISLKGLHSPQRDREGKSVTAVITIWKRDYLEEQIQSLINQTYPIQEIWLYQYEQHLNIKPYLEKYSQYSIKYFYSDLNFKFFGRYSLIKFVKTEYTFMLDDDVIPGNRWIENAIRASLAHNAIVGVTGRIISPNALTEPSSSQLKKNLMVADADLKRSQIPFCPQDTEVDHLCNCYFFKTIWLDYFWGIKPFTWENGDDIHLSASCQILGGIKTVVPIQDRPELCGNLKPNYGFDSHASFIYQKHFFALRYHIVRYLIVEHKWQPLFLLRKNQ